MIYKPKVYIAGPYAIGEPLANTYAALAVAEQVWGMGMVPFVPHLTHWWHEWHPHPLDSWLSYDLEWLAACDALYRLPGDSEGADREVAFAKGRGIPMFTAMSELATWKEKREIRLPLCSDRRHYGKADEVG